VSVLPLLGSAGLVAKDELSVGSGRIGQLRCQALLVPIEFLHLLGERFEGLDTDLSLEGLDLRFETVDGCDRGVGLLFGLTVDRFELPTYPSRDCVVPLTAASRCSTFSSFFPIDSSSAVNSAISLMSSNSVFP